MAAADGAVQSGPMVTHMPSPFPGMDPYLEEPGIWPDLRHELISGIRAALNVQLRPKYFARLEDRVYLSDENDPGREFIIPDVRMVARPAAPPSVPAGDGGGLAVLTAMATEVDVEPVEVTTLLEDEIHDTYITVIDRADRAVVAVIEVLSPTNKAAGSAGRAAYVEKRREVLRSPTHLVEIDLIRGGLPIFARERVPPHDYLVHVSRARSTDGRRRRATVWPIPLAKRLPTIPVPLRGTDPDAQVDLQAMLITAYDRGAYEADVDYAGGPAPPLDEPAVGWARAVVERWRNRPSPA